ncbi:hypothetical protein P2A57_23320 [Xanthomonas perforans]
MIEVFFDESHTANPGRFLVGGVAYADPGATEERLVGLQRTLAATNHYWAGTNDGSREMFSAHGFHHTDDPHLVKEAMYTQLNELDFRGHFAWMSPVAGFTDVQHYLYLYRSILTGLAIRYSAVDVKFVFEQHPTMNRLFEPLVRHAEQQANTPQGKIEVLVGSKASPCLSTVDYLMAVLNTALRPFAPAHERRRVHSLNSKIAHLYDADFDYHTSSTDAMIDK